jgi:tetratricopeptide (TPR) repeat protein
MATRWRPRVAGILVPILMLAGAFDAAAASRESEQLTARAYEFAYNLDHEEAAALFRQAIAADPADPAPSRGLAAITWLHILFRRGTVTSDDYLGRVAKPHVAMKEPPAAEAALFKEQSERALALAEKRLGASPSDPDALYQVGSAVALMASYNGTVDGRIFAAFRAARRGYDAHERVLELDKSRKDAALVVGTYRYLVSTLTAPMRLMAYVAGFGGGREEGVRLIEDAARYHGNAQTDARFALVLIYNRERRFPDALRVLGELAAAYPRNRLLKLELGSTLIRAGRARYAEAPLSAGLEALKHEVRPLMYGEEALWLYKRGAARVAVKRYADAEVDLRRAIATEGRDWVRGRAHTELARIASARGDVAGATTECHTAIRLGDADADPRGIADARRVLRSLSARSGR